MIESKMSVQESQELISRLGFGRLACSRNNQPYIVPIYFASDSDHLYGFATMGQKIEWMRSNPLVCVEIDEIKSHVDWASVVLRGRYEELPDTPEFETHRQQAHALLEKRSLWWQTACAAAQTRAKTTQDIPVLYCIHIEEMSGRRVSADPVEISLNIA
jgi:uncharacterized protein